MKNNQKNLSLGLQAQKQTFSEAHFIMYNPMDVTKVAQINPYNS